MDGRLGQVRLEVLVGIGRESVDGWFDERVFPVLTPLAVDPGRPFPHISNLSLNLAILIRDEVERLEAEASGKAEKPADPEDDHDIAPPKEPEPPAKADEDLPLANVSEPKKPAKKKGG